MLWKNFWKQKNSFGVLLADIQIMKSKITTFGLLILMAFLGLSCKTKSGTADNGEGEEINQEDIMEIIMTDKMTYPAQGASFTVSDFRIKGDIVSIDVSYSGSRNHDFELYGNKFYMKSLPPKLGLFLKHDSGSDEGKKKFTETLHFDVKATRYPDKDKDYSIILMLNNTDKTVEYAY